MEPGELDGGLKLAQNGDKSVGRRNYFLPIFSIFDFQGWHNVGENCEKKTEEEWDPHMATG